MPITRTFAPADQPGDSDQPTPAWHWGADPSHGGQTRHKGARENCPAPDCEPEHPAAFLLRAAAAFVRLVADANTAIGENRALPREMQGRTRAEIARADMHPAVGHALADWLEAMAGEVDGVDGEPWVDHAVAVARAVLGKGDPT